MTYLKQDSNQSSLCWIALQTSTPFTLISWHSSKQASEYIRHDSFVRTVPPSFPLVSQESEESY